MCLRDHPDGGVLVHRGSTAGYNGAAPSRPLPPFRHHAIQRCKSKFTIAYVQEGWISVNGFLCVDLAVSGVHAVLEGHKHVVRGGADGRGGGGALESAQAHRLKGAAVCRCTSSTVSQLPRRHSGLIIRLVPYLIKI